MRAAGEGQCVGGMGGARFGEFLASRGSTVRAGRGTIFALNSIKLQAVITLTFEHAFEFCVLTAWVARLLLFDLVLVFY